MINTSRQCDKCLVATAQYLLPTSDLAFCAHHWTEVPEDVRVNGKHLNDDDDPAEWYRNTSITEHQALLIWLSFHNEEDTHDDITEAAFADLTQNLSAEFICVARLSHTNPDQFVTSATYKDIVS
jgi:hypothetical protein